MALIDDVQENFKHGIMEMLLLKLLSQEDMYGYQMKLEINALGSNNLKICEGSMYGPLYRLQKRKYISEKRIPVGQRRVRVYYHIEPEGLEYLQLMLTEYEKLTIAVAAIVNRRKNGEQSNNNE